MKEAPIVIFATDLGYRVARGDSIVEFNNSAAAQLPAAQYLAQAIGRSAAGVILAIPAVWCLSATVPLAGLPARNRRGALLYRLELLLPLSAEDIAADYLLNEPASALAVCVSTASLKELIDAIEAAGTDVQSIVPASIYAASRIIALHAESFDSLIWQSGDLVEVFVLKNRIIAGWYVFPASADDLRWHLQQLIAESPGIHSVLACGVSPKLLEVLKEVPDLDVRGPENHSIESVVIEAVRAEMKPPINLRRDGLAPGNRFRAVRRPVIELGVAVAGLIVCICAAALWRANLLQRQASAYRAEQEQLFREALPGRPIPSNLVSRLQSEQRLIESGSQQTTESLPQSTLPTLQGVLSAIQTLTPEVRLQVQDLKVTDDRLSLDALVRNRNDLNAMIEALRQASGFQLDPPQTEQIAGKGLHITITGAVAQEPLPK